jgi:hypothetical protein
MCEPRPLATLGASMACNRDIFTFLRRILLQYKLFPYNNSNMTGNSSDYPCSYFYRKGIFHATVFFQMLLSISVLVRLLFMCIWNFHIVDSKGFWWWCIALIITGISDFVYCLAFWKLVTFVRDEGRKRHVNVWKEALSVSSHWWTCDL